MPSEMFERLWFECGLPNSTFEKKKQLINISYNPLKQQKNQFLEELSRSIDLAVP